MKNMRSGDSSIWIQIIIAIVVLVVALGFGFRQKVVRNFGGSMTIELEPNTRLVNATWKGSQLWLLTTDRTSGEPVIYNFIEKSAMGILQGNVTIVEK